jgi:serine/threonine protein phosphatase 1
MTNIIGDIAGQYVPLVKLVGQMPAGEVISVGDMVDRGPDSQRVIEYFMKEGRRAILGNHEHMMVDSLTGGGFYGRGIWIMNGGGATLTSYDEFREKQNPVPQEHIDWILGLPRFLELKDVEINGVKKDVFISHAFLRGFGGNDPEAVRYGCEFGRDIYDKDETTIVWNRGHPIRRETWDLQVCGHNSQFGLREWADDEGTFAICLDDSRKQVLTGLHLETMTIYQQPYE